MIAFFTNLLNYCFFFIYFFFFIKRCYDVSIYHRMSLSALISIPAFFPYTTFFLFEKQFLIISFLTMFILWIFNNKNRLLNIIIPTLFTLGFMIYTNIMY